jgi:hypothetical protein
VDFEADMSARSVFPGLVIITAALASIATSQVVPEWTLSQRAPAVALTLNDAELDRAIAIQGVLRSSVILEDVNGGLTVHLQLRARDVSGVRPAEVRVTLESAGFPPVIRNVSVLPAGTTPVDLFQDAFGRCATEVCVEDYTISIQRLADPDAVDFDVSGEVLLDVRGFDGEVPPPGTVLELDVTDLGPLP